MTEVVSIARNTAALVTVRLLERATNLVLIFFISRMMGAGALGVYAAAMAFYGAISIAAEIGASNYLIREIARHPSDANRYVSHVLFLTAGASIVLMGVAGFSLTLLDYSEELQRGILVALLATLPATFNAVQEAVFVAFRRVEFQTYTTFVASFIQCAASLCLLYAGYGVIALIVAFVVMKYALGIVAWSFCRRLVRLELRCEKNFVRVIVRGLRSFSLLSLLSGLCARPELIILSIWGSEAVVGLYSAATKLVEFWYLVPQAFMANVFPVLSRACAMPQESRLANIQNASVKYLIALSLPIAAGLTFAAGPILNLIYGSEFTQAAPILQCAAWTLPLICLNAVFWRILVAHSRQDLVLRVQAVSTMVRIGFGYAFIAVLGATGAALSAVVSLMLHNAMLAYRIRRQGTPVRPYRLAWRFALGALLMSLAMMILIDRVAFWMVVIIAALFYIALSFWMRAFSREDLLLVRQILVAGKSGRAS